eukprot:6393671-Amphidinium_carterae.1
MAIGLLCGARSLNGLRQCVSTNKACLLDHRSVSWTPTRQPPRLGRQSTAFFLCDVQEKFRTVMPHIPHLALSCSTLLKGAACLELPVIVTEQYPRGLGHTLEELDISKATVLEKTTFSMYTAEVRTQLQQLGLDLLKSDFKSRSRIVLFGLETHVCVQQTALDLLAEGYEVVLVADAVASQRHSDRAVALTLLRQVGAIVTTVESLLMALITGRDEPEFATILKLVKDHAVALSEIADQIPPA